VFSHKTVNLSRKIQDGDHSYILKANLNIIPNRIETKTFHTLMEPLKSEIHKTNCRLLIKPYGIAINPFIKYEISSGTLTRK